MSLFNGSFRLLATVAALIGLAAVAPARATTVAYTLTADGSSQWLYTFAVTNNTAATAIQELTVYFDDPKVLSIAVGTTQPAEWSSPIAFQPDPALGNTQSAYGAFDTISDSLGAGVAVGKSLGGFTALVTVAPGDVPGADLFDVYDSSFDYPNPLDSGTTQLAGTTSSVPEPGTLGLLLIGASLAWTRRARPRTV
jgi:hypothetical protein